MHPARTSATMPPSARLKVPLRPGVSFPDWSVVDSRTVCEALDAIIAALGAEKRWSDLEDAEDRVRRSILDYYAEAGHSPSPSQLVNITGFGPDELGGVLEKLRARDMVVLDQGGETIAGAYPFTQRDTGHRVGLGDRVLNAMCAIDALGVGAMYGKDVTIDSTCAACGEAIHIQTRDGGAALAAFSPSSALVWSGIQYFNGCAADSLCTVMAFFCCDEHLESWRNANHPDVKGFKLSMDEGLQVGKAIFGPMLATASSSN